MTIQNGLSLRDAVYGWDLNNRFGFESFKAAMETIDQGNPPYGSLFKVRNEIYQLKKVFGRPVFDFYEQ